jgi:Bacterial aa3 type cytochrome c oxidase subunit IV
MAEQKHEGALETGVPMDYAEHDKTYSWFLSGTKYLTLFCVALLMAMAFGFFVAGWFSATILFIVVFAAGAFIL